MRSLFCFYDSMGRCFADPNGEPWSVGTYPVVRFLFALFGKQQMPPECIKAQMWTIVLLIGSNIFMIFACYGLNYMNALF